MRKNPGFAFIAVLLLVGNGIFSGCSTPVENRDARLQISVTRTNYHGWPDSLVMSNGKIEAIVVPAIGRVMQLRFAGEADGPFWENRALDGRSPDPKSREWGNFGGDKTWPSPQADWPKVTPRGWPPPQAFDSLPVRADIDGPLVTLVSPVDPDYGIRTVRDLRLHPEKPVLTITTTYEKVSGPPSTVGVWIITQLKDPVAVFAPIPKNTRYPAGYNKQSDALPSNLKTDDGLLSLTRDPKAAHKIGCDAGTLLWIGEKLAVRIDAPRVSGADYPDQGSSAEIYTNPDPLTYVELEMLGPLHTLRVGESIKQTNTYTLLRRTEATTTAEARRILESAFRPSRR